MPTPEQHMQGSQQGFSKPTERCVGCSSSVSALLAAPAAASTASLCAVAAALPDLC